MASDWRFLSRVLFDGGAGAGTFGRVYLAEETALGKREVALKLAPGGGEEANLLGKLRHPNIVPVYSVQQDEASGLAAFCGMPILGRATLADVLDSVFETAVPPERARCILDAIRRLDGVGMPAGLPATDSILSRGTYLDGVLDLIAALRCPGPCASTGDLSSRFEAVNVLLPPGRPTVALGLQPGGRRRFAATSGRRHAALYGPRTTCPTLGGSRTEPSFCGTAFRPLFAGCHAL